MKFSFFMNGISVVIFCFLLFLLIGSTVHAADFYFDGVAGNDTTGDGSQGNPWQTIVKIQETVQCNAGSTIHLKAGSEWNANDLDGTTPCGLTLTYAGDGLAIYQNGITVTSYGTGTKPRIINPRAGDTNAKTILVQGNNVTINGLLIDDRLSSDPTPTPTPGATTNTAKGIYVFQSTGSVIQNNEVKNVGEGIVLEGENNFVTLNNIHDLQMIVNTNNSSNDDSGAIGVVIMKSNNEVSYNTIQNCRAPSYDFAPTFEDGGAMEFFAQSGYTISGNYIHHNTTQDNEGFMEMGGQSTSAIGANTISYNFMKNNRRLFYFNLSGTFALTSTTGLAVYHNTLVDTSTSLYGYYIAASSTPATSILTMKNNIFYFDNSLKVSQFSSGITHSNNVFFDYNGTTDNTTLGLTADTTDKLLDPVFTNSASNYTLTASSPAINLGATLGTVTRYNGSSVSIQSLDLAGNTVPVGAGADAGAYEFQVADTPTPTITLSPTITPISMPATGSSSLGSSSSFSSGTPSCSDEKPSSPPELFQINTFSDKAELFITPAGSPYSDYVISYSYFPPAEQWGASFSHAESTGVIRYTINELPLNSIIYVKVRASNGCQPGDWSNILRIQTGKTKTQFTPTSLIQKFTLFDQIKGIVKGVVVTTSSLARDGIGRLFEN